MDRPNSGAVCKSKLDCEEIMAKIYKTFSDIIEDSAVYKFNPYHDKLGRFTTSGSGGVVTGSTSDANPSGGFKKVGERTDYGKKVTYGESDITKKIKADISASAKDPSKPSKIDTIYETRDEDGRTLAFEIGVKGNKNNKIVIANTTSGNNLDETLDDFFGGIDEARTALSEDIEAMENCDLEHFGMWDTSSDDLYHTSNKTSSEDYLEHQLEFEITKMPKYYPATWESPAEYDEGEICPSSGSDPYGLMEALDEIYRTYL